MNLIKRAVLALVLMAGITPAFAQAPAPVPALPDTERRTSYSISASTCACGVGFQLYGDSTDFSAWLEVFLNGVKVAYNDTAFGWTITVPTGSLATRARPISDAVLTFNSVQTGTVQIVGAQRPRRLTEVSESRGVAARDFNQYANTTTAELREVWDRFLRTPRVPAGETLALLPPLSGRASTNACWDAFGNLNACVGSSSGSFAAGAGIQFNGTNPTTISVAVAANPTTVAVSSRAVAQTLDLHAYSVITTGGYALGGDGGQATFKNVGSASFIDSFISTFSIQGSTGCTNGTYGAPSGSVTTTAVTWQKSGNPSLAIGTATVAGGAVTAVNITGTPGNGYSVGDVLTTAAVPGCSPTITVTGITTAPASFIDSVGTHFQFVPDTFPNVLQFGAKGDWNGTDAGATNNFAAIQAAANFAGYKSSTSFDSGGWWGGKVMVPSGSYMMCGSTYFVLPEGTVMEGPSAPGSATLRLCDTFNPNVDAFMICDPTWGFACLGTMYKNISFSASRSVAVAGAVFMVYSNNLQDFAGLREVYVYGGQRGCFHFEKGYGGSSWVGAEKVSCNIGSPNNPMIRIGNTSASGMNFGSTIVSLRDIVIGGPSSGPFQLQAGMEIYGGFTNIENAHCELINGQCIFVASPAVGNPIIMRFTNINSQGCASGGTCTGVVTLAGNNDPGNVIFSEIPVSTYAHVIENGQPSGTSFNTTVKLPIICDTTCHN